MFGSMSNNVFYRVLFPVAVYFVLFNMLYSLIRYASENLLGFAFSSLYCGAISGAVTIVVMYFMYRNANVYKAEPVFEVSKLPKELLFILAIIALGVVLNLIATHFPLTEVSDSFARAENYLSDGDMFAKILANVIITPALEELVFRGIVCGELEKKLSVGYTVVISAALFGILHFNWVQMIYAFLIGLLIGYVYEETHKLWVVYAGHALLNLTVVLVVYYTA